MRSDETSPDPRWQILREAGIDPATVPAGAKAGLLALAERVRHHMDKVATLEAALQEATALADRDPLCPVFNRRAFLRELVREIAVAERHGTDLSVLYLDLVAFKRINDDLGHAAGDKVLRAVAKVLIEHTRQTDIKGRLGGDEFAVALPRASLEDASAKALELESLIASLSTGAAGFPNGPKARITASFGCASWAPGMDAEALLASADQALYDQRSRRDHADPARDRS